MGNRTTQKKGGVKRARATKKSSQGASRVKPKRTRTKKPAAKRARHPASYTAWDDWEAAARINDGLRTGLLEDIRTSLDLTVGELAILVQISPRTLNRRKSQKKLSPDESERVYRILKLIELAADVFGTEADARDWMKEPNFALASKSPLDLARSEPGAAIVERLLLQVRYGVAV